MRARLWRGKIQDVAVTPYLQIVCLTHEYRSCSILTAHPWILTFCPYVSKGVPLTNWHWFFFEMNMSLVFSLRTKIQLLDVFLCSAWVIVLAGAGRNIFIVCVHACPSLAHLMFRHLGSEWSRDFLTHFAVLRSKYFKYWLGHVIEWESHRGGGGSASLWPVSARARVGILSALRVASCQYWLGR